MADNRKYYYLKLKESYFDDDAIYPYSVQRNEIPQPCSHDIQVGAGGRSQETTEKRHTRLHL